MEEVYQLWVKLGGKSAKKCERESVGKQNETTMGTMQSSRKLRACGRIPYTGVIRS
jgi:hypothetical protein